MSRRFDQRFPVLIRVPPPRPGSAVEVRGEMTHWRHRAPMRPAGGWLEAVFEVPPGVYEYKLRLSDSDWRLDPTHPRTRARDGARNSVLVVGGTEEPILHAPARPDVFVEDDGRLRVRAALRRGHGDALALRWDEGDGPRETSMRLAAVEDEHLVFEACLPGAGTAVEYLFLLADGRCVGAPGGGGQPLRVEVGAVRPRAPAWWREAIVYSLLVDRFRTGGHGAAADPGDGDGRAGGDLRGIIEGLDHLTDLGVTVLHLTPVCRAPSAHRYDAVEPRSVDPALGGEEALAELLDRAHDRGLRVILDVPVTHVHRDHPAFRDVRARGRASPYWSWFHIHQWPFAEGFAPGYEHYQGGQWHLPLLRTEEPAVADDLVATFERWADLGADGFRIDACADVPIPLTRRITRAVRERNPDAAIFAEVIPDNGHRWTSDAGVDATTDFVWQQALYDWLWRRSRDAGRVAHVSAQRRASRGGPGHTAIAFTATHDQPRLRSLTGDRRRSDLGLLLLLTQEAVPMLYYGDEIGLSSSQPDRDFEDVWPDRLPMPWDRSLWDRGTLALTRAAIAARRASPALRRGQQTFLDTGADVLGFRRRTGDDVVDVLLNGSDEERVVDLEGAGAPEVLLAHAGATVEGGVVRLPAWAGLVVGRRAAVARDAIDAITVADRARELATAARRAGSVLCPAPPTHLYVTITESCNLRCAHCITDAPARTRSGRARTIQPWLIDALREPFAAARYVAFTHGGESLVSPRLYQLLGELQRARAGRPGRCDVHLASNGMLLSPERVARLIDLGVTSIMVSIDGARPETNDRIRHGGRLRRVVDNLHGALEHRARTGADLRIGLSAVIGRSNAAELADLGALALDVGVDWLKIEETYPATPFASFDLLRPDDDRIAEGMAALRERVSGRDLVLVDHLAPPGGCRCGDDPAAAAFRAADDYANRFHHCPARAAWDQACVDPDGTVHAIDPAHPGLGTLADAPLEVLWNHPALQERREHELARWGSAFCE